MKRDPDRATVKLAVANSTTSGALVGTAVDAKGFGRAKFIFTFGTPLADGSMKASSIGIWCAAGSASSVAGATTYASVPSAYLAAMSTGVFSNNVAVLDMAIPAASFWLKVSGTVDSSNIPHSAVVELYEPVTAPPTHASPAPVIVN
jgi:hypothetical protein